MIKSGFKIGDVAYVPLDFLETILDPDLFHKAKPMSEKTGFLKVEIVSNYTICIGGKHHYAIVAKNQTFKFQGYGIAWWEVPEDFLMSEERYLSLYGNCEVEKCSCGAKYTSMPNYHLSYCTFGGD